MSVRHCLVTGANRGLGLEFVRQLLAAGHPTIAACRQPGRATALNRLAAEHPGRLHVLPLDVADARSREELVRELPLVLQDAPLRLLVNNAGVLHGGERFGSLDQGVLEDTLRINTVGPLLLAQALAPLLADHDGGGAPAVVANISSQLGAIATSTRFGTPSYAIAKAAQNMASVQLGHALAGRGIRVVALHPGWVATDMGGTQAPVTPEEAVAGLLRVIDGLATVAGDVAFLDWQGHVLPW